MERNDYPKTVLEVIDDSMSFNPRALSAVRAFKATHPWRGSVADRWMSEAVIDKGYHSKQTLLDLDEMDIRSYASEPARGRQSWDGQDEARDAVYANRRRVKGERGRRLLRSRGEKLERTFAHCYETGAMRRLHLRGRDNVAKRVLLHAAAFNVGLMMRVAYGLPKPRSLSAKAAAAARALFFELVDCFRSIRAGLATIGATLSVVSARRVLARLAPSLLTAA